MTLSVVIPTKDKAPLLARTLDALDAQDLPGVAWEIVVVDDGSCDGTAALLARRAAAPGSRLRPVSPGRNVGRAAARNLGWRSASGRWVVFLDDDIIAPPHLLAAHLRILAADPRHGTIGHAVTEPAIVDAAHFAYLDSRGVAKLPSGPAPARYFVTQNAGVPREALAAIGGFDEGFSAYGFEDMDIGFRLEDWGVRFQVLPAPVPHHIHHHTFGEYLDKKRVCGRLSLPVVAQRHPGRIAEMRLDLIIDPVGRRPGWPKALLRSALRGWPGRLAVTAARHWPVRAHGVPVLRSLHARVMDAAVLAAYCQGLAERGE